MYEKYGEKNWTIKVNNCDGCGRQVGSYFGGDVISGDVTNDGIDELFISAPLYVSKDYDEGKVFIYISNRSSSLDLWV